MKPTRTFQFAFFSIFIASHCYSVQLGCMLLACSWLDWLVQTNVCWNWDQKLNSCDMTEEKQRSRLLGLTTSQSELLLFACAAMLGINLFQSLEHKQRVAAIVFSLGFGVISIAGLLGIARYSDEEIMKRPHFLFRQVDSSVANVTWLTTCPTAHTCALRANWYATAIWYGIYWFCYVCVCSLQQALELQCWHWAAWFYHHSVKHSEWRNPSCLKTVVLSCSFLCSQLQSLCNRFSQTMRPVQLLVRYVHHCRNDFANYCDSGLQHCGNAMSCIVWTVILEQSGSTSRHFDCCSLSHSGTCAGGLRCHLCNPRNTPVCCLFSVHSHFSRALRSVHGCRCMLRILCDALRSWLHSVVSHIMRRAEREDCELVQLCECICAHTQLLSAIAKSHSTCETRNCQPLRTYS